MLSTILFVIAILAMVWRLVVMARKNRALAATVAELDAKANRPFGLATLEAVGAAMGSLSAEVVKISYVNAAVDGRPNTVPADLADAVNQTAAQIGGQTKQIEKLQILAAAAQNAREKSRARAGELAVIGTMLPPK